MRQYITRAELREAYDASDCVIWKESIEALLQEHFLLGDADNVHIPKEMLAKVVTDGSDEMVKYVKSLGLKVKEQAVYEVGDVFSRKNFAYNEYMLIAPAPTQVGLLNLNSSNMFGAVVEASDTITDATFASIVQGCTDPNNFTLEVSRKHSKERALATARALTEGVDTDVPIEYLRGVCELLADLYPFGEEGHADNALVCARLLGANGETLLKMYPSR